MSEAVLKTEQPRHPSFRDRLRAIGQRLEEFGSRETRFTRVQFEAPIGVLALTASGLAFAQDVVLTNQLREYIANIGPISSGITNPNSQIPLINLVPRGEEWGIGSSTSFVFSRGEMNAMEATKQLYDATNLLLPGVADEGLGSPIARFFIAANEVISSPEGLALEGVASVTGVAALAETAAKFVVNKTDQAKSLGGVVMLKLHNRANEKVPMSTAVTAIGKGLQFLAGSST